MGSKFFKGILKSFKNLLLYSKAKVTQVNVKAHGPHVFISLELELGWFACVF